MNRSIFFRIIPVLFAACLLCLSVHPACAGDGGVKGDINTFKLGMSVRNAEKIGAKATDDPSRLRAEMRWEGAQWEIHLIFADNTLASVIMVADGGESLMSPLLRDMAGRGYMPITAERDDKTVEFYALAAAGKSDEECRNVLTEELRAFAKQKDGECTVLFGPSGLFSKLVQAVKAHQDEGDVIARHPGDVVYAVQLDKKDGAVTVIMSTVKTLTE